ncbi:MAG TPA: ACP phosphodiesterase [Nevskiaceae bacterium]|nr:ACP phosphodiesterase [Nevskiaceae bacterium]
MNFLAHLWLADRTGTSLAGSVLGDVVRGADLSAYPDAIAQGIRFHRKVDGATDRHSVMVALKATFADGDRRYAGIVLDLAADFALAQEWATFSSAPLPAFTARCAREVAEAGAWFTRAGGRAPTTDGFAALLLSYGTDAGIERALARTATRLREPARLVHAGKAWRAASDALRPQMRPLLDDLLAVFDSPLPH